MNAIWSTPCTRVPFTPTACVEIGKFFSKLQRCKDNYMLALRAHRVIIIEFVVVVTFILPQLPKQQRIRVSWTSVSVHMHKCIQ